MSTTTDRGHLFNHFLTENDYGPYDKNYNHALEQAAFQAGNATMPHDAEPQDFVNAYLRLHEFAPNVFTPRLSTYFSPTDAKEVVFNAGKRLTEAALTHSASNEIFKALALHLRNRDDKERAELKGFLIGCDVPAEKLVLSKHDQLSDFDPSSSPHSRWLTPLSRLLSPVLSLRS